MVTDGDKYPESEDHGNRIYVSIPLGGRYRMKTIVQTTSVFSVLCFIPWGGGQLIEQENF